MGRSFILGLLLSFCIILQAAGQNCLGVSKRNSDPSDPPFNDNDNSPLPAIDAVQAIITTYRFNCDCVNITSWETYLERGDRSYSRSKGYDITFQVWRPSPTVDNDGCYSLVGENRFSRFTFPEGGLVQLTPTPPSNSIIAAQSGDVVGYYTNNRQGPNNGIQLERNSDYTENMIWYLSLADGSLISSGDNACPYPIGPGRLLSSSTGAAPMLRISSIACSLSSPPLPSSTEPDPLMSSTLPVLVSTTPLLPSSMKNYETSSLIQGEAITSAMYYATSVPASSIEFSSSAALSYFTSNLELVSPSRTFFLDSSTSNPEISSSVITSSTSPIDLGPSGRGTNAVIPAVIVIVVLFIVISTFAVVTVTVVFLRKRVSVKSIKLNRNVTDLSNPNYSLASVSNSDKGSKGTHLLMATQADDYEILDNVALDYSHPEPLDYTTYAAFTNTMVKESLFMGDKDNELYHEEGPDAGPRQAPPLPVRNSLHRNSRSTNQVKESIADGPDVYEVPLLRSTLEAQESVRHKNVFDTVGNYVLTEEQRHQTLEHLNPTNTTNTIADLKFFTENSTYWSPASTTSELYSQLATKKYRELQRDQIRLEHILGSGEFGEVYKATWTVDDHKLDLAVKTLKSGASENDEIKFLQEAAIMGQFRHKNVIKMYGVVTLGEPILICLEVLENGDLHEYLLKFNPSGSKYDDFVELQLKFLKFAKDIAAGMEYLSKKSFVHRDLAARNILINKYLTCKVSDFGMARNLMDDDYYTSSGGKIPVKWTAPEALLYKKYSTDSDVWSYGMVLFEIWSVGRKPFSCLNNNQTLQLIQSGFCQAPPPGCPLAIYQLMVNCWNPEHQQRPSFTTIWQRLNESPEKLLYWSPSDDSLSSAVGVCGAALLEAEDLHSDLQKKYMT